MFSKRVLYTFLTFVTIIFGWSNLFSQAACNFSRGPVGELCSSAIYICGSELDGYTGKLPDSLSEKQPWDGLCNGNGTADNIIWFSFTPCSSRVCLEITPFSCSTVFNGPNAYSGIQAGLFTNCNRNASVACTDHSSNNGVTTPFTLCYDSFIPGQTGYLFIDGYSNSVCQFRIKVLQGIDTTRVIPPDPTLLDDGAIVGKNRIECTEKGKAVRYNLTPPQDTVVYNMGCQVSPTSDPSDSICYVWQVSPVAGRFFANKDSVGLFTDIVFTNPGVYTISANGFFHPYFGGSCANAAMGDIISWTVTVEKGDTIVNQPIILCPGASALFCDPPLQVTKDTVVYCKTDDCTTIAQPYIFQISNTNNLGVQYICQGSSFDFQGQSFSLDGVYETVDINDCSLKHIFEVKVIDVKAEVSATTLEINCGRPEINVSGKGIITGNPLGANLTFSWFDPLGDLRSNSSDFIIGKGGTYTFRAEVSAGNALCKDDYSFVVTTDFNAPVISVQLPVITCKVDKANLIVQSSQPITASRWFTPKNQVIPNILNIEVDSANCILNKPYQLFVESANGCKTDTSFLIPVNFKKPNILLQGDDLNCKNPVDTVRLTIDMISDSIIWSKVLPVPQQAFYGSFPIRKWLEVTSGGTYEARVKAMETGCWNVDSIDIAEDKAIPSLFDQGPLLWHCNSDSINITALTDNGIPLSYDWTTQNGAISGNVSSSSIHIKSPGTYNLKIVNLDNGCSQAKNIVVVEDTNKPTAITVATSDISCFGKNDGSVLIENVLGGYAPYSFAFDGNIIDSKAISGLKPGQYSIEVSDKFDCKKSIDVIIKEPSALEVTPSAELVSVYITEPVSLSFSSNYSFGELASVIWKNVNGVVLGDDFELNFQPEQSGEIELTVITEKGCEERVKIKIVVEKDLNITIPNVFSPNGDGVNDHLVIQKNRLPANTSRISIFDRYGNKVFDDSSISFNDPQIGWDGTFNGKPVESGVYVLVLEVVDITGQNHLIYKDVTILK